MGDSNNKSSKRAAYGSISGDNKAYQQQRKRRNSIIVGNSISAKKYQQRVA